MIRLIKALRKGVGEWKEQEDPDKERFDFGILGEDVQELLQKALNSKTELMHLNLSITDSNSRTSRRKTGNFSTAADESPPPTKKTAPRMVQTDRK